MNISGILVVVPPEYIDSMIDRLDQLDGIDVHHRDDSTGRIVITQEAEHIRDEVDGLKRIKALPHVILAEMVYHCFEEDGELFQAVPPELNEEERSAGIPPYLNK
jgi:periplasmic nitrate reductase NapD